MTELEDVFHYLKMPINHIIDKKITFCQNTYLKNVFDCFKMTKFKLASIPIDLKIAIFLLFYNKNIDKKTISGIN